MKYKMILIGVWSMMLQACMNVASTGVQAFYYRHDINNNLQDYAITTQAYRALQRQGRPFDDARVVIATLNKEVLLLGQVPTEWQKRKIEDIVRQATEADHIYNVMQISAPLSTLTQVSDTWITAKIKAQLMASNDLDASQIKVVTENGVVYLMGLVKPEEAEEAKALAAETTGVSRVVGMFSYMYISKKYISQKMLV